MIACKGVIKGISLTRVKGDQKCAKAVFGTLLNTPLTGGKDDFSCRVSVAFLKPLTTKGMVNEMDFLKHKPVKYHFFFFEMAICCRKLPTNCRKLPSNLWLTLEVIGREQGRSSNTGVPECKY